MCPDFLPYGRQIIDDDDVAAVERVLRSDWLTTGPEVDAFEREVAAAVGAKRGVAVSNGTTALHAAYHAAGVGPGDEVIVPSMTFAATANAACFLGATPIFADVDARTLCIDPESVKQRMTPQTKAIVGVDFAGHPCDWDALRAIADEAGCALIADGCHAIGGAYQGRPIGSLADATCFSFHPVKHVTTGEGGMVVTDDDEIETRLRRFRNHGLTSDHRQRAATGSFLYDMVELGHNLRITDIQCALGRSQLRHLGPWVERRRALAARYREQLRNVAGLTPLGDDEGHAYHLFIVRVEDDFGMHRDDVVPALRAHDIGANVHYKPVHMHTYYRETFGTGEGLTPVAEEAFEHILSLPMFPAMADEDVDRVVAALKALREGAGAA